jgi:hypothetical protein
MRRAALPFFWLKHHLSLPYIMLRIFRRCSILCLGADDPAAFLFVLGVRLFAPIG